MKSEKGITLVSLTIYIVSMAIVVGIVAVISNYFYTNTINESIDPLTEYTKFNSFFTDEINHENIKILECKTKYEEAENVDSNVLNSYIVFDNGVQYTFIKENKGIYKNKVKICSGIEECTFKYEIQNGKHVVKVNLKIQNKERETTFTLKN